MNEKLNPKGHNNGTGARACERAEDLVTYLYGEAAPADAKDFRQHLSSCAVCRDEFAAFGGVREVVGEWRDEALSAVPALGIGESFKTAFERPAPERKRSAVAALREFFSLSPVWLRAGAVAAALVVCALAALTLAQTEIRRDSNGFAFRFGVQERIVEGSAQAPTVSGYTQEQVDNMLADERAKSEQAKNQEIQILKAGWSRDALTKRNADKSTSTSRQQNRQRTFPGNQRNANDFLADGRGNGDVFNTNEEKMPRLTDLLGAVNNPK